MDTEARLGCLGRLYQWLEVTPFSWLLQVDSLQSYRARAHGVRDMSAATATRLVRAMLDAGVGCHLVGGWGVDALIGRQTRLHDDLDVAYESVPGAGHALESVLSELGYRRVSLEEVPQALFPVKILLAGGDGRSVDLLPMLPFAPGVPVDGPDGSAHLELPSIGPEAFVTGSIGRRSARMAVSCLGAEHQLASRESYEPRRSDRHDVARILRHNEQTSRRRGRSVRWGAARHRPVK